MGGYEYEVANSLGTIVRAYSNDNVFNGLPADTYTIRVRDANGCIDTDTEVIADPVLVSFSLTKDDSACNATTGGSITVTPAGGTGNYTYVLTNTVSGLDIRTETGTGVLTFANLSAGSYEVTVSDSNNCSVSAQSMTLLPSLDFLVTQTKNIDCSASPDGVVTIDITSGSGTYEYSVENSLGATIVAQTTTGGTTVTFNVATADTYTVEVFDMGATPNCSNTVDIEILPSIQPNFSLAASVDNICNGSTLGEITITEVSNSINPLTYTISPDLNSVGATADKVFGDLPAGVYTITGTGTNSCVLSQSITINENTAIDISGAVTVTEFGCTTGNVTNNAVVTIDTASITGGTGTYVRYVFVYTPTSGSVETQDGSNPIFSTTNGSGGTVDITVYDDNNCTATLNTAILPFNVMSAPVVNETKSLDCRVLPAGGATIEVSFTSSLSAINASVSIIGTNTGHTDTVTGTSPVTITGLPEDTYTISITNTAVTTGCVLTTTHQVNATPIFSLDVDKTSDVSCIGTATGSFNFDYSTTSPYSGTYDYEVFNATTNVSTGITGVGAVGATGITGLVTGSYYVVVTQTASPFCPTTSPTVTIDEPTAVLDFTTVVGPVSCNGGNDGSLTITGVDGWGGYEFEVADSSGTTVRAYSNDNVFNGLPADTYTIRVRDANGCIDTDTEVIADPVLVSFSLTKDDSACNATTGGNITVTPVGGTGNYTYILTNTVSGLDIRTETGTGVFTFTNIAAGSYEVTVSDSNNCSVSAQSITLLSSLDFLVTQTKNIDCSASPDGVVTIDVTSGSGTYEYAVVNSLGGTIVAQTTMGGTTVTFNVATADTYTVEVFDMGATPNCSNTVDIEILPSIQPNFSLVASVDNICNGSSTGEILITEINTSINPLTYTISPDPNAIGSTSDKLFTGLPAGVYTINGTGTNACTFSQNITINENTGVDVSGAVTLAEFGCTTGNVTNNAVVTVDPASITGGTGTYVRYDFVYIPASGLGETQNSTSNTFALGDETGGIVTVTVYDDNGCSAVANITVAPFGKLETADVTVDKEIDCATGEDITVTYTSSNPIPAADISYTITGGNTGFTATNATGVFTNLATDIYSVEITNSATGCVLETAHEVLDEPDYIIDINKLSNAACLGSSTGEISFEFSTTTPYTGNYNYEVFQSNGTTTGITGTGVTGVTTATGLAAGSYYVELTMTDNPFCPINSTNVTIEEPTVVLTVSATPSLISCVGPDSGEVALVANGGWGTYEYELVNTTTGITIQSFDANDIIDGLNAGQYTATVRDLNGCTETTTFELLDPTAITATTLVTPNQCNGDQSATIAVTNPAGGQGSPIVYSYTLTYPDGTISAYQSSNMFTNLEAGDYVVTVYDDYSCESSPINVTITDPTRVIAQAIIIEEITCNRNQSTIEVSGSGGTGTYTYSMDGTNFVSGNTFDVDAGRHNFYVMDANGCISDPFSLVTVDPYEDLASRLNIESGFVTCNGENNGVLSATVSGGLGNYQYELLDSSGGIVRPIQDSNMFSSLPIGIYSIRVYSTNSNGDVCNIETVTHEIEEPEVLTVAETHINVSCNGGTDGSITINAGGGNGGYEFNIIGDTPGNPSSFLPNKFVPENVFENLQPDNYTITIKDSVGCYDVIMVTIAEPSEVNIALVDVTQQVCATDPSPTITIEATGGSVPGGTVSYIVSINGIALPGSYPEGTIVLGAAEGIEDDRVYGISVQPVVGSCTPTPLNTSVNTTKAIDLLLESQLSYNCPTGNVLNANVQDEYRNVVIYSLYDASGLVSSNDTGIFENLAPGDGYRVEVEHINDGCPVSVDIEEVRDIQALQLLIDDSERNKLIASGDFGLPPYEFSFDGGSFSSNNEMTILETRDYSVIIRDARGCEVELTVEGVYITIEVPNLFTPDGDGVNDYWYPINVEDYHGVKVYIYDRYARRITEFEGSQQGWDGTYQGRALPSGDYWYTIYFKELSGQERKTMGHFTLYR
ncbi:gliding motility-associated C-terminal domain-containing protein [Tenacibaculum sp. MAR_2009_124]|uniref:T9SS type B sorting domain-containing protein n=1 Tax=Tenacibaculum sp. MAR_2009_124 TaxID=1250059 RepID=UPI00089541D9|nr:T9SS type B sorting domain-containing protein [Tenacibaculum sp. MAR_2009_124]SEC95476.1 gliding motility-associated C-terminal domain-containing protein [Tenacibaculum sp. MAR_2009_124]